MTEETIKQIASIAWKGAANAHRNYPDNQHTFVKYWEGAEPQFDELKKQLLEQHEAEMMDFTEWKDANYVLFSESPNKYVDRIESNRNPSKILPRFTTTDLLTLFKNRNK